MAKMDYHNPELTSAAWAGDFLDRDCLIPGGVKVVAAAFTADSQGRKPIKSGTLLGRTLIERAAGTGFGPAADTDEEFYLLAFDVTDAAFNTDAEVYSHQCIVKENLLPGWSTMATELKTIIRANYQCILGVE